MAHCHGGIWSAADPARSLGIGESTIRRYLDLFTKLLVVRQLQPWHENLGKRQVKAPKVYVRDSGLLHVLLGIRTETELMAHPKNGASWEGYVLEETLKAVEPDEVYFWATHQGAELDLLLLKGGRRLGVEIKLMDAPKLTASMRGLDSRGLLNNDCPAGGCGVLFGGYHCVPRRPIFNEIRQLSRENESLSRTGVLWIHPVT